MRFIATCNVIILLGALSIGLYAMHLGHPVYAGFCMGLGFIGMMNYDGSN